MSEKKYTGSSRRRLSVVIAGKKINLFINSGIRFVNYDKIIRENPLRLPTGNILPIAFITEEFEEYVPMKSIADLQNVEELLRGELLSEPKKEVRDG